MTNEEFEKLLDGVDKKKTPYEYNKEHYDVMKVYTPRGAKSKLKEVAKQHGISLNQLLTQMILSTIEWNTSL